MTSEVKRKGQVISQHKNAFFISQDFFDCGRETLGFSYCSVCARAVFSHDNNDDGDSKKRKEMMTFCDSIMENTPRNHLISHDDSDCGDDNGARVCYCSLTCKKRAQTYFLGTNFLFYKRKGSMSVETSSLERFFKKTIGCSKRRKDRQMEIFYCSLLMASTIYKNVMEYENAQSENEFVELARKILSKQISNQKKSNSDPDNIHTLDYNHGEKDDKVLECWTLVRSAFPPNNNNQGSLSEQFSNTPVAFTRVQRIIARNYLHPICIYHPLYHYIEKKLLSLNDSDLVRSLEIIEELCGLKKNSDGQIDEKRRSHIDQEYSTIYAWRKATHLVQMTKTQNMNDEEMMSMLHPKVISLMSKLNIHLIAFAPQLNMLKHSCIPNCFVEGYNDVTKAVKLSIVSLNDIGSKDVLSISKINNLDDNVDDRAAALKEVFGQDFICKCVRCKCERDWKDRQKFTIIMDESASTTTAICNPLDQLTFTMTEFKHLGDLAMQYGKYSVATAIYDLILKKCYNDNCPPSTNKRLYGDLLHARCASILERGLFTDAQRMWKEAYMLCGNHGEIEQQVKKQNAYNLALTTEMRHNSVKIKPVSVPVSKGKLAVENEEPFEAIISKKCYLTKEEFPVITPKECNNVIEWAETAATSRKDGWTTSRHYAVPTTDIPIHEVPIILNWFNNILANRLRPMLALQFGESEVGRNGCDVDVHDAFVVRYDAKKQRHLPLHRDQSTHSFTIALNGRDKYEGGGTFIAKIKKSLRPSLGGVLSFRGDELLHGGDPLIRGQRYIIVAFCYVSKRNLVSPPSFFIKSKYDEPKTKSKRRRFDYLHKKDDGVQKSKTSNGDFTFGFKL